jgi:hypothetical protein
MAKFTQKLEFLVDVSDPVTEINHVIFTFLQFHAGKEAEILTELQTEITQAIGHYTTNAESAVAE